LNLSGYRVWEASNGAEALAQHSRKLADIDLLVTDIVMPVMSGLKLAEECRTKRPGLRVLFMTGHSEEVIATQSGPDPLADVVQKPFVPDVLVRKVRELLNQGHNGLNRGESLGTETQ
jgi:two-component system cell cycle sensor histidine kinase/response regulator CckA